MKTKIRVIGGGNMGGAIIAGIAKEYNVSVCEQDKKRCQELKKKYKVTVDDLESVVKKSKVLILAIKPQDFEKLLKDISSIIARDQLVISIAAGITCQYIENLLGKKVHVVRTMPNLAVQVGKGITGICPGNAAVNGDLILACRIFSCIGKTVVVEEKWMDAVTAVSGSGPAYVFLFVECMNKAAKSLGLEDQLSDTLIMEVLKGSVDLLEQQKESAANLRARVTSKGGTTQAAMDVFSKNKIENIFSAAFKAATQRAHELSK